ncbi:hypothetical protein [Microbacterium sp. NPDC091662]|uniref:hypothetical protein n=1 Tax=Microbacterium sp. NPDC091662 TaxID=3364211 RepID=UPI003824E288
MVMLAVRPTSASVMYEPEVVLPHLPCEEVARAMVTVEVHDVDSKFIESRLNRKCEVCGLDDSSDPLTHDTLVSALALLAPPAEGEMSAAEIAEAMLSDMALSRAEQAAELAARAAE